MKLCCKCKREATYDSPKLFCDLHWQLWFMEDYTGTPKELYESCVISLKHTWKVHGKPTNEKEILRDAAKAFGYEPA